MSVGSSGLIQNASINPFAGIYRFKISDQNVEIKLVGPDVHAILDGQLCHLVELCVKDGMWVVVSGKK